MGFGPVWKGCWDAKREELYCYPVNRWSTKRAPNGTKLDRQSTGAIPGPLGKPRSIPRTFNTHTQKGDKRGAPVHVGVSDCETDNGENARMHETNTYANEMHMMT